MGASYILGWMNTWQTKRVVEETLKRVGTWDKVTAAEVRRTSEGWGDADVKGLGNLTYGKNLRGTSLSRIAQVKKVNVGGKDVIRWDYATDWRKAPFLVPKEWQDALRIDGGKGPFVDDVPGRKRTRLRHDSRSGVPVGWTRRGRFFKGARLFLPMKE